MSITLAEYRQYHTAIQVYNVFHTEELDLRFFVAHKFLNPTLYVAGKLTNFKSLFKSILCMK